MIKNIFALKKDSDSFEGRVKFVTYLANSTLLITHLLFFGYYLYNLYIPLIIIDLISIIFYMYYYFRGIRNSTIFGFVTYILILIHTIIATICFGWEPGFYLWLFALVCAFFLPSFGNINNKPVKRPIYMGLFYILTFYVLGTFTQDGYINPIYKLDNSTIRILFTINSALTFLTIQSFTYFYTKREKMNRDILKYKADYDLLTGLRNRRAINQIIDDRINTNAKSFPLAILDIDFFKSINDTYGHEAGDVVLRDLASLMRRMECKDIISARWGGEEFLILGPSSMTKKEFIEIMNKLRELVEENEFKVNNIIIKVTVSIGVARYNSNSFIKVAINDADQNLYKAKQTGRNKVV